MCDFLREKVNIQCGDDLLHTITGILDVNCHEVKSSVPGALNFRSGKAAINI